MKLQTGPQRVGAVIAAIVVGVVALNLLAQQLDRAVGGSGPGGVGGSSYATASDGLAAYATLLSTHGHDVQYQRGRLDASTLSPDRTVVVVDPQEFTADDAAQLREFVGAGGRLVFAGRSGLHDLRAQPPTPAPNGAAPTEWTHVDPSLGDVRTIQTAGNGSWTNSGSGRPLVTAGGQSLLTADGFGRGEVFFLADSSPLQNQYLATGDNAAFALALAGDAGRSVTFAEGVHGFSRSRGLAAIPDHWKVALMLIGVAAATYVWSRARRFGPPDRLARELPPARAEYVNALSTTLERTHEVTAALAPVRQSIREYVITRATLPAGATDEQIARAARSLGCDDAEIAAFLQPRGDNDATIALGRMLARVSRGGGRAA